TFRAFNPPHLDPTASYTLSLHDALPIWPPPPGLSATSANRREGREVSSPQALASRVDSSRLVRLAVKRWRWLQAKRATSRATRSDRKSTRLNSSHVKISYAVFCLKKKK